MSPKSDRTHEVTCSEAISLLYLLHPVPAPPLRNVLTDHEGRAQGYSLSLSEELSLVESLAFLSNVVHDVNRIPAVCVQQCPETSSLNVLVAVNQSSWGDGSQFLQRLREGFEPIFALLAKPRQYVSRQEAQDEVLTAIISMCSSRILHRLRLLATRGSKPKQPIQAALRTAIYGLRQVGKTVLGEYLPLSIAFVESAKAAIRYAEAWVNHQTMPRLKDLVKAIHSLKHTGDVEAMLAKLPNQNLDPSMRRSIINILNKVARYCDISRLLLRMSKKQELIQRMNLIIAELPQSVWARSEDAQNRSLAFIFSQVSIAEQKQGLVQVLRTLKITHAEANQKFMAQTRRTLDEAKIHAEVQLVYYCELNPSRQPPRIIASNKDACYLCNAFISMHGKMHTSRTHGRLYPGWRLPVIPNLGQLERSFNTVLAAQIRASVDTSLSRGCKTMYPDPNESTLLSLVHSETTIVSRVDKMVEELNDIARISTISSSSPSPNLQSSARQGECTKTLRDGSDKNNHSQSNSAVESLHSSTLDQDILSSRLETCDERMIQGHTIVVRHGTTHVAGELELHLESTKLSSSGNNLQTAEYSIQWMAPENVELDGAPGASSIIDLEALQGETTFELDAKRQLLIGARGVVVKIRRVGR